VVEAKESSTMASREVCIPSTSTYQRLEKPLLTSYPSQSPQQAWDYAGKMIGAKLITKQTGAAGRICNAVRTFFMSYSMSLTAGKVMLAERRDPSHEYYVAVLNDRVTQGVVLVVSNQGGMNIEEVAATNPGAIITTPIDFEKGLSMSTALELARTLGIKEGGQEEAANIFINLYKIFKDKDATQIEINPMAETVDGHVLW